MPDWLSFLDFPVTPDLLFDLLRAATLLLAGLICARLAGGAVRRLSERRMEAQQSQLLQRVARYVVVVLFTVAALHQLGFDLTVLLGAAGVLSVAIGFASQTSASNFISGLFLIAERPFSVGDLIEVAGTTGEVLSIDPLSVKLRTYDNLFVRIPNETLIKSEVKTLTRFPIRRVDVALGVAYRSDLAKVRAVLFELAESNPLCLSEPEPLLILKGFGDSSIDFQFSVWAQRENFLALKNSIQEEIKLAFDGAGIEIPFPQRAVSAAADRPLPVRLVDERPGRPAPPDRR